MGHAGRINVPARHIIPQLAFSPNYDSHLDCITKRTATGFPKWVCAQPTCAYGNSRLRIGAAWRLTPRWACTHSSLTVSIRVAKVGARLRIKDKTKE
jgi:hypothetical protein